MARSSIFQQSYGAFLPPANLCKVCKDYEEKNLPISAKIHYICTQSNEILADMKFISVTEFAEAHGLSERTVRNWCAAGKVEGAFLTGKTWSIPADAPLPNRGSGKKKPSPLLK